MNSDTQSNESQDNEPQHSGSQQRSIASRLVDTARLRTHLLESGDEQATPVIFVHGNFSSAVYYASLMLAMPDQYRCLAVDLRGYGDTEDLLVDATRGARDWADDLAALLDSLNIDSAHWVAWSGGAAAVMQLLLDQCQRVESLTLVAPVSPYGFGGSKDAAGTPVYQDYAGSGGGLVAEEFARRVARGDRSSESPMSPRNVIRSTLVHPSFCLQREDELLDASLQQKTGEHRYPGDARPSNNWPHLAPGDWGPLNALSVRYLNLSAIVELTQKPPVLWIRGDRDVIISDRSLSDAAVLGELGLMAGWPGQQHYPAQPMVAQTRGLLERYRKQGGEYKEVTMAGVGHSPFLERQQEFLRHFIGFID